MVSDGTVPMNRGKVPLADQPKKMRVPSMNREPWKCSANSGTNNPMRLKMTMTGRRPKRSESAGTTKLKKAADRPSTLIRWLIWPLLNSRALV